MNDSTIDMLVADWDEVYKKGQLTLWMLLAIYDGKKYSAQIATFMNQSTNGEFEVKEQSLYRALRRFTAMGLVLITEEQSPNSGPKRKYFQLTDTGRQVLSRFINLHIVPLIEPPIVTLVQRAQKEGK